MNRLRKYSSALVLGLLCGATLAQAAQQAEFHLPMAAHWGRTTLEAGVYRLTLPVRSIGESQVYVRGQQGGSYEMPMTIEDREIPSHSYVKLVKIDGEYFVKEYGSKTDGRVFTFHVPKSTSLHETAWLTETMTLASN